MKEFSVTYVTGLFIPKIKQLNEHPLIVQIHSGKQKARILCKNNLKKQLLCQA